MRVDAERVSCNGSACAEFGARNGIQLRLQGGALAEGSPADSLVVDTGGNACALAGIPSQAVIVGVGSQAGRAGKLRIESAAGHAVCEKNRI